MLLRKSLGSASNGGATPRGIGRLAGAGHEWYWWIPPSGKSPRPRSLPGLAEAGLAEALADAPVVLIHGPRQCGKTTLARLAGDPRGYLYLSFDDATTLGAATADPVGFVADLPDRTILDEVQRAPGLFTAIKAAVDRNRTAGPFLLTGSADLLLVPRLADSSRFLEALFAGAFKN